MKRKLLPCLIALTLGTASVSATAKNTWEDEAKDAWIDGKAEAVLLFNTDLNSFDINTDVRDGQVILTGKVDSELDKRMATEIVRELDGVTGVDNQLTVLRDRDEWIAAYKETRDDAKKRYAKTRDNVKDWSEEKKDKMAKWSEEKGERMEEWSEDKKERMEEWSEEKTAQAKAKWRDAKDMDDDDFWSEMVDAKITTVLSTRMLFADDFEQGDIDVEVENGVVSLMGFVPTEAQKKRAEQLAKSTEDVTSVDNQLMVRAETVAKVN